MNSPDRIELWVPAVCEVFDAYAGLQRLAAERGAVESGQAAWLGGWLLGVFELEPAGIAALVGGAVAGAAVLAVDGRRERVKELLRLGICDFVVNDLDEAVRILKNEVRKRQAVSVGLVGDPEAKAGEMVERGLQPELLAGGRIAVSDRLVERGAVWVRGEALGGIQVGWRLRNETAAWAAGAVLARVDELAAAMLDENGAETAWRRAWLQRAPRYMGRRLAAERCVRMSEGELERLVEAFRRDAALTAQVLLQRDGVPVEL